MSNNKITKSDTISTPSIFPLTGSDEEDHNATNTNHNSCSRRALRCLCCCSATIVTIGLTVLILALTIFKIKDPTLTLNSLTISHFQAKLNNTFGNQLALNITLIADISVKNPNMVSFSFCNGTTDFFYEGEAIGVAYTPSGTAKVHRTVRMNASVDVLADKLVRQIKNPVGFILDRPELELVSVTNISGKANVLGIYKRGFEVVMNCNMTLALSIGGDIKSKECEATVS